jgi:hypothetical protein
MERDQKSTAGTEEDNGSQAGSAILETFDLRSQWSATDPLVRATCCMALRRQGIMRWWG